MGVGFTANGGHSTSVRDGAVGRGTGGTGGKLFTSATNGEDGVYPWGDSTDFSSYRVSGCGGGGAVSQALDPGIGGAGGGGDGGNGTVRTGVSGSANTGGGGGGGAYVDSVAGSGGSGGSGVVLIRWGY